MRKTGTGIIAAAVLALLLALSGCVASGGDYSSGVSAGDTPSGGWLNEGGRYRYVLNVE
jgi:hypothetical protein